MNVKFPKIICFYVNMDGSVDKKDNSENAITGYEHAGIKITTVGGVEFHKVKLGGKGLYVKEHNQKTLLAGEGKFKLPGFPSVTISGGERYATIENDPEYWDYQTISRLVEIARYRGAMKGALNNLTQLAELEEPEHTKLALSVARCIMELKKGLEDTARTYDELKWKKL